MPTVRHVLALAPRDSVGFLVRGCVWAVAPFHFIRPWKPGLTLIMRRTLLPDYGNLAKVGCI